MIGLDFVEVLYHVVFQLMVLKERDEESDDTDEHALHATYV